ncbi:MAG: aldehyde dehydrogenase family protein [Chloroflexi bacterium]|jgi:aldehyde dehydrogenase (NAD+)|nr:aldehyde dehydrogenase family protein [Chloroflexota bacterium]
MNALLDKLTLKALNSGVCSGHSRWVASTAAPISSENPTTGAEIARVIPADAAAYDTIVADAQTAFQQWRSVPAPKRGEVIRDLGALLREYREPLGELVSLETGKIRAEGVGEVQEMIDICDFAVGLSRQLYGLTMHSERPAHRMYEQWHPIGPIGIITAFNFPVAVWSWNAALAAVCGDTMVWKPSELAPLCGVAVQHLANRVMADHGLSGVFTLAVGTVGQRMAEDARLPLISFTGSIPTGRRVAQTVAGRLGRSLLELGGNNAILVSDKADLDLATRAIVFGAVGTAGQRCTSTRRIIAHETIVDELAARLVNAYQQVRIGDPLQPGTLMGPLITLHAVESMVRAIERAMADGGQLLTGGRARPDIGARFVEPAILRMPAQSAIVREETFAPILYILTYRTLEEAIELHNGVTQGLSSAIFTDSLREAEQFLSAGGSDCGIANVNLGTSGAEIGGAFGGEKDTGGGRESGSDAWKAYMRRQTTTINGSRDLPLAQGITFE